MTDDYLILRDDSLGVYAAVYRAFYQHRIEAFSILIPHDGGTCTMTVWDAMYRDRILADIRSLLPGSVAIPQMIVYSFIITLTDVNKVWLKLVAQ